MQETNFLQELKPVTLSAQDLELLLPHRDIALKILDSAFYDPTKNPKSITAFKKTLPEDPYFIGHYPGKPILPGHWQIEAMCLTSGLLFKQLHPGLIGNPVIVGSDGKMRFQRAANPGDNLMIHSEIIEEKATRGVLQFHFSTKIQRESDGKLISFMERLIGSFFSEKTT